jgi:hypothetical protein
MKETSFTLKGDGHWGVEVSAPTLTKIVAIDRVVLASEMLNLDRTEDSSKADRFGPYRTACKAMQHAGAKGITATGWIHFGSSSCRGKLLLLALPVQRAAGRPAGDHERLEPAGKL